MDTSRLKRLCTYVVREDTGLAPNPFWGWCTVAVCTPNHQGARLAAGDWLAGFLAKARDYRLLYAMEVAEVLDLDRYFYDPRFELKRPNLRGNWMQRCGDNFYSRAPNRKWIRHRNRFHLSPKLEEQDTRHAKVYIGSRFFYLGRAAIRPPDEFAPLAGGRGIRTNHDPMLAARFREWVDATLEPGVADVPNDNPDMLDHPLS